MASTIDRHERRAFVQEHYQPEGLGLLAQQLTTCWRWCLVGWGLFVLAVGVIALLALRPALIPYPLIYDPDGRLIWHGTAATTREERFIDVRLVEWVAWCRAVSSDEPRFRQDRAACASMVHGAAVKKFETSNAEMIATYKDPHRRVLVQVDLMGASISRQGADRVQIRWEETWTPETGYGSETHRFQVTLTYAWYARPSGWTLDRARLNPSRVYVTDYWWDEVRTEAR